MSNLQQADAGVGEPAGGEGRPFSTADVTLAVMNYNGADRLPALFESIQSLNAAPAAVMIVDDGSTDGGAEAIREQYPGVRIESMGRNTGLLNRVRNRAFETADTPLVFIVDNDVVLKPDTLDQLLHVMNERPRAAACITRTVYWHDQDRIYQDGQTLHYVGASPGTNRERLVQELDTEPRLSIGWGVQLIDREAAREVGFFNPAYPMGWGDDGEFNHKLHLYGYECYHVPKSVVLHKRESGSKRYQGTIQNRLRFILEMYQLRTIMLSLPAFFLYELSLVSFLAMKGAAGDYFRGWLTFLRETPDIMKVRRRIQSSRKVPDRELMGAGDIFVYSDEMTSKLLVHGYRVLNLLLNGYWRLIVRLI
ncbi:MAG: glycosyltransferase [Gammaproteobacteria bacterium]|nr:glycosyltransferase [Gammaproteobacteria bacterium]